MWWGRRFSARVVHILQSSRGGKRWPALAPTANSGAFRVTFYFVTRNAFFFGSPPPARNERPSGTRAESPIWLGAWRPSLDAGDRCVYRLACTELWRLFVPVPPVERWPIACRAPSRLPRIHPMVPLAAPAAFGIWLWRPVR